MAAESGTGVEGVEAEGLGLGGVDDFMDVDPHAHAKLLQLVDEGDVDAAVDVFKQLGHFGNGGAADGHDAAEDGSVKCRGQLHRGRAATAHHLGNVVAGYRVIAGVFTLGRESYMKTGLARGSRGFEAVQIAFFENGNHDVFSGAGIGRAFENDKLAIANVRGNGMHRSRNEAQVGLVILVERRGDTDDDCVHGGDLGVVGSGAEA